MNDTAMKKGSGRTLDEWKKVIKKAKLDTAAHKQIARYLQYECGVSPWWAQEVTVAYEKAAGKRITGQTADAGFQVGVSKTYHVGPASLWETLVSAKGMAVFTGKAAKAGAGLKGTGKDGREFEVTTFEPGSHLRMRWRLPGWDAHSILQVRVTPRGPHKAALMIHHEKLADAGAREEMKTFWKNVQEEFGKIL